MDHLDLASMPGVGGQNLLCARRAMMLTKLRENPKAHTSHNHRKREIAFAVLGAPSAHE
jgi:hypothetical protein